MVQPTWLDTPQPTVSSQDTTIARKALGRCEADEPNAADWLALAEFLARHDPAVAACAASLAFEREPGLLRHARTNAKLAGALRLVARDRNRRLEEFLARPEHRDADPNAVAMLRTPIDGPPWRPSGETRKPFQSYYPGLPHRPWFDADELPWVRPLARRCDDIAEEWRRYVASGGARRPYVSGIRYDGAMADLHDSDRWSTVHLMDSGRPRTDTVAQFPATMESLTVAPQVVIPRQSPEVFFSRLAPKTTIPPHYGQANWKLTVHLGIDVPEDCTITVDGQTRRSETGRVLAFDDSYRHEACNDSERPRTHLVFETWHPGVSQSGRTLILALHSDRAQWRGARPDRALRLARRLLA